MNIKRHYLRCHLQAEVTGTRLSLKVITQTLWLLRRYFKLQQESLLWRPKTRPHARMPLVVEEKFMIVNIIAWNVLINDLLIIISIIQKHLKIWTISPSYQDCYYAMVNSQEYDVVGVQNLIKLVIADYWLEMIRRQKLFWAGNIFYFYLLNAPRWSLGVAVEALLRLKQI